MCSLVIYFNEMSCGPHGLGLIAIQSHAAMTIGALISIGRLRSDTILRLPKPFKEMTFGGTQYTFSQLFPGHNDDNFRVLMRYLDRNPYGPVAAMEKEVVYNGKVGIGMSWAHFDESFVLSIGYTAPWSQIMISAVEHALDSNGNLVSKPVDINNIATPAHVTHWQTDIEDYSRNVASSSLVYDGEKFVIRMYFDDHDPQHVHIYPSSNSHNLLAKIRIDNGDVLIGQLPSTIRRDILSILDQYRDLLRDNWRRCRSGRHPLQIH